MLRKRTRSVQKDQQMSNSTMSDSGLESYVQSDCVGQNPKSFFGVPGLFVGLSPKALSDSDSVRSPTSPLDFRMFSNLGNPYRSPRSPHNGHLKSWDCSKVGLSIVDSLDDHVKRSSKVLRPSESKNIIFGPGVRVNAPKFQANTNSFDAPKSLPRNFAIFPRTLTKSPLHKGSSGVIFEIGEAPFEAEPFGQIRSCSLDSCRYSKLSCLTDRESKVSSGNNVTTKRSSPLQVSGGSLNSNNSLHTNLTSAPIPIGSSNVFVGSFSASEIELSEDYTCVITHGPNPKKTHIYGDCILECYSGDLSNLHMNEGKEVGLLQPLTSFTIQSSFPSNDFLSFCYHCNKKLEEGKDIYMYRGENAFCSLICRAQEIMIDEELEKTNNKTFEDSLKLHDGNGEELFETGIFDDP